MISESGVFMNNNNNDSFTIDSPACNDDNGKKSESQATDNKKSDVFGLSSAVNDLTGKYVILYAYTKILLSDFMGVEDLSFPIDYFGFANWLGLDIQYDDLNFFRGDKFSKVLSKLVKNEDGSHKIVLDNSEPILSLRYAVCHEIAHFLLEEPNNYCVRAHIPESIKEITADITASFIMLPPELTFDVAWKYTERNITRPVDMEEIYNYISIQAQLPKYNVIISYEHLKLLACYLHNKDFFDIIKGKATDYLNEPKNSERIKTVDASRLIDTIRNFKSVAANEFFA